MGQEMNKEYSMTFFDKRKSACLRQDKTYNK